MEIIYEENFDDAIECIAIFERHYILPEGEEPLTVEKDKNRIAEQYNIPVNEINRNIRAIADAEDYVIKNHTAADKRLRFFFNPNTYLCRALYSMSRIGVCFNGPDEEENYMNKCKLILLSLDQNLDSLDKLLNKQDFFDFLSEHPCSNGIKWKCMMIFNRSEELRIEFESILNEAMELFGKRKAALLPLARIGMEKLKESIAKDGLSCANKNLNMNVNVNTLRVIPSAMGFDSLLWEDIDLLVGSADCEFLYAGVLREEISELIDKYTNGNSVLLNRLKALSDKKRLDILKALSSASMTGQEISEMFSLSKQHVYYHMGMLSNDHFVNVEKQGAQVNYQINKDTFSSLIEDLKKF